MRAALLELQGSGQQGKAAQQQRKSSSGGNTSGGDSNSSSGAGPSGWIAGQRQPVGNRGRDLQIQQGATTTALESSGQEGGPAVRRGLSRPWGLFDVDIDATLDLDEVDEGITADMLHKWVFCSCPLPFGFLACAACRF